jgi:hypothetical protein
LRSLNPLRYIAILQLDQKLNIVKVFTFLEYSAANVGSKQQTTFVASEEQIIFYIAVELRSLHIVNMYLSQDIFTTQQVTASSLVVINY